MGCFNGLSNSSIRSYVDLGLDICLLKAFKIKIKQIFIHVIWSGSSVDWYAQSGYGYNGTGRFDTEPYGCNDTSEPGWNLLFYLKSI